MAKLQRREWAVIVGGAVLILLAGGFPLGRRVLAEYERVERGVTIAKNRLEDAKLWRQEVESDRSGEDTLRAWIEERGRGFNLYSFVREKVGRANLEGRYNLSNQNRGALEDAVVLNVNGIELKELVGLLHDMYEGNNLVAVEDMTLGVGRSGGLDCRLTLISPK